MSKPADDLDKLLSPENLAAIQQSLGVNQQNINYLWMPVTTKRRARKSNAQPGYAPGTVPQIETVKTGGGETNADEVKAWVYNPAQQAAILAYLTSRGITIDSFDQMEKIWMDAVDRATAAYMSTGGQLKRTPWDMIDLVAPSLSKEDDKAFPWKGKRFSEVTRTENVAEMGPETARTILRQALQQALGRDPNEEEIEDFASRANYIVSSNPQISETEAQYEWDPNLNGPGEGGYKQVGSKTRQVGKSAEEVQSMVQSKAEEMGKENPEYGEIQASTNLANWLFEAISSPVD